MKKDYDIYVFFMVGDKKLIAPIPMPAHEIDLMLKSKVIKIDKNYVEVKDFYYDVNYPSVVINVEKIER